MVSPLGVLIVIHCGKVKLRFGLPHCICPAESDSVWYVADTLATKCNKEGSAQPSNKGALSEHDSSGGHCHTHKKKKTKTKKQNSKVTNQVHWVSPVEKFEKKRNHFSQFTRSEALQSDQSGGNALQSYILMVW